MESDTFLHFASLSSALRPCGASRNGRRGRGSASRRTPAMASTVRPSSSARLKAARRPARASRGGRFIASAAARTTESTMRGQGDGRLARGRGGGGRGGHEAEALGGAADELREHPGELGGPRVDAAHEVEELLGGGWSRRSGRSAGRCASRRRARRRAPPASFRGPSGSSRRVLSRGRAWVGGRVGSDDARRQSRYVNIGRDMAAQLSLLTHAMSSNAPSLPLSRDIEAMLAYSSPMVGHPEARLSQQGPIQYASDGLGAATRSSPSSPARRPVRQGRALS